MPVYQYHSDVPCVPGSCFSCGDSLQTHRLGRCWRCALAWRLVHGVPLPTSLLNLLDGAKVGA
jgi:hypothetical protein